MSNPLDEYPMTENEFRKKLLFELHEINLSLREMSGRNSVPIKNEKPMSYADKYFARSEKK